MTKRTFPDSLDTIILGILHTHVGQEKAILRTVLLYTCQTYQDCDDSQMRLAVQSLREAGHRVCNMKDGRGYFIAKTENEYHLFKEKYAQPVYSTLKAIKAMDDRHPGQMELEVV